MTLLWWLLPALAAAQVDTLAERILADVDGELVLMSDLRIHAALQPYDRLATAFWSTLWGSDEARAIDAATIRQAAREVDLYDPSPKEVQARLTALQGEIGGPDNLRALLDQIGLPPRRLEAVLYRRLVVDRYLIRNLRTDPDNALTWTLEAKDHVRSIRKRIRIRLVERQ